MPYFDDNQPWYPAFNNGQFNLAIRLGLEQLNRARSNPATYAMPKGTPFYFMGIAAFASHDYQTATFFFDAAAAEDVRHHPGDNNQPALLFMRLETTNQKQAAKQIVEILVDRLNRALQNYAARKGCRTLTLDNVRDHFLNHLKRPQRRTLTATFISFLAEWQHRAEMIDLAQDVSREPFFTHLFRGCLLFESLLKEQTSRSHKRETLGRLLNHHHLRTALRIDKPIKAKSPGLQAILRQLKPQQGLRTAIQCTAQTRNTLGHNLVWAASSLNRKNYDLLANNIAASCLHAIACLYLRQK